MRSLLALCCRCLSLFVVWVYVWILFSWIIRSLYIATSQNLINDRYILLPLLKSDRNVSENKLSIIKRHKCVAWTTLIGCISQEAAIRLTARILRFGVINCTRDMILGEAIIRCWNGSFHLVARCWNIFNQQTRWAGRREEIPTCWLSTIEVYNCSALRFLLSVVRFKNLIGTTGTILLSSFSTKWLLMASSFGRTFYLTLNTAADTFQRTFVSPTCCRFCYWSQTWFEILQLISCPSMFIYHIFQPN